MFYHKDQNQIETSAPNQREFQLQPEISHTYIRTSIPRNDNPAEISAHTNEPADITDDIHNFSKAPTYDQVYIRKKKKTIENQHNENEENIPHIMSDDSQEYGKQNRNTEITQGNQLSKTLTVTTPLQNYLTFSKATHQHKVFLTSLQNEYIPKDSNEALTIPHWKQAMTEELEALEKNHTWDIVPLPPLKRPTGCKWVFTIKYLSDGRIERYKARLVAQGYNQVYGIDYGETFAPVAKMNTIRILITLAVQFDWPLQQYDVKNAFLHGELEEEIYMKIPPGYSKQQITNNSICKLKKSLYGLKQSSRAWFGKFSQVIKKSGYSQSNGDHTLFYKHSAKDKLTILVIYVDDIIITGNDPTERAKLEQGLKQEFAIKNLGRMKYFLGIEIAYSKNGILLSQQKYVLDLLVETGFMDCRPAKTPMEVNHKLNLNENEPETNAGEYQRLVGRLIYLAHTRPDISYAVNILSQFMHSPRLSHLQAAHRVLRYLKGTTGLGLHFRKSGMICLDAYTDSDFAGSLSYRRSTSGYCLFLAGNLVIWRSKKQDVVARSSTEAEFRALAHGLTEIIWIKRILQDLKIEINGTCNVFCDNQSTIRVAHNPVQHDRMKHVSIDRHYIKETLEQNNIQIPYIQSAEQRADVLTKGLPKEHFMKLRSKLGLMDIHSSA